MQKLLMKKLFDKRFLSKPLTGIVLIGLIIRLLALFYFVKNNDPAIHEGGDAEEYTAVAFNLLEGKGYVSDEQGEILYDAEPVFPTLLAFIYWSIGRRYFLVRIFNLLLSAGIIPFTYKISKVVFRNERIAILGAIVSALHPALIFWSTILTSDTFRVFILALLSLILLFFWRFPKKHAICLGCVMGLSVLTRISFLPFIIVVLGACIFKSIKNRLWKSCTFIALSFLLTLAPWLIRNHTVYGVVTLDGRLLKISQIKTKKVWIDAIQRKTESKITRDIRMGRNIKFRRIDRIITNYNEKDIELKILPKSIAQRRYEDNSPLKNKFYETILTFWELWRFYPLAASPYPLSMKLILGIVNGFVFFAGIIGMILSFRKYPLCRWLIMAVIFLTASHVYTGGPHARYILPVIPFMIIFTSFFMIRILYKMKESRTSV